RAFLCRFATSPLAMGVELIWPDFRRTLERSLGDPERQATLASKHAQQSFAADLGIPTPCDRPVRSVQAALEYADQQGFPVVAKHDFNSGGKGVWIGHDRSSLEGALQGILVAKSDGLPPINIRQR